jgi:hypothetical protein
MFLIILIPVTIIAYDVKLGKKKCEQNISAARKKKRSHCRK